MKEDIGATSRLASVQQVLILSFLPSESFSTIRKHFMQGFKIKRIKLARQAGGVGLIDAL